MNGSSRTHAPLSCHPFAATAPALGLKSIKPELDLVLRCEKVRIGRKTSASTAAASVAVGPGSVARSGDAFLAATARAIRLVSAFLMSSPAGGRASTLQAEPCESPSDGDWQGDHCELGSDGDSASGAWVVSLSRSPSMYGQHNAGWKDTRLFPACSAAARPPAPRWTGPWPSGDIRGGTRRVGAGGQGPPAPRGHLVVTPPPRRLSKYMTTAI